MMARPEFDPTASNTPDDGLEDIDSSIDNLYFGAHDNNNLGTLAHRDDTLLGAAYPPQEESNDGTA
jgi:hypothetical protein